jgi:hypothetical protein
LWSLLVMCMARPEAVSQAKPSPNRLGQARPKWMAWWWLWPGLRVWQAKARPWSCGFWSIHIQPLELWWDVFNLQNCNETHLICFVKVF